MSSKGSAERGSVKDAPLQTDIDSNRSSKRLENQPLLSSLQQMIDDLNIVHHTTGNELKSVDKPIELERLTQMRNELAQGLENLDKTFHEFKEAKGDTQIDHKLIRQLDRVKEDSKTVTDLIETRMDPLIAKPKQSASVPANVDAEPAGSVASSRRSKSQSAKSKSKSVISHHSSKLSSVSQSHRSSSHKTRSSHASQALKIMQAEAAAEAVEKEAQLQAEIETQKIELEIQKSRGRITQAKLKAELDAKQKKQQIFAQAIQEEEGDLDLLMHPPTLNRQTANPQAPLNPPLASNPLQPHEEQTRTLYPTTPLRHVEIPTDSPNTPVTIASSQADFAEQLASALNTVRQKPGEPSVFYGETLKYLDWKTTFHEAFDFSKSSPGQKWLKLQQYVGGRALEAITGFSHRKTEEAYKAAWKKLDKRYGKPEAIAEAYEEKLNDWPKIKANDGDQLERFVDFLESCTFCISSELDLNTKAANKLLIQKLPYHIAQKWSAKATKLEKQYGKFPPLQKFIDFLSDECDTVNNSLSKVIQGQNKPGKSNNQNSQTRYSKPNDQKSDKKANSNNAQAQPTPQSNTKQSQCLKCKMKNHRTSDCFELGKQDRDEQVEFIKKNFLCFSCLKPNHKSEDCNQPAKCNKRGCGQTHPSIFHDYIMSRRKAKANNHETRQTAESTLPAATQAAPVPNLKPENKPKIQPQSTSKSTEPNPAANANNSLSCRSSQTMSWTLPVYVSSKTQPDKEILVYALMDSGADNSFITTSTIAKLPKDINIIEDSDLSVSTLSDTDGQSEKRREVFDLQMRGYNQHKYVDLPNLFAQSEVPINRNHIPTPESVRKWPHLSHLSNHLMPLRDDLEVGLLIGGNLTQAFIPREYITGEDHEPFAKRTDVGWNIMGNSSPQQAVNRVFINRAVVAPTDDRSEVKFTVQANTHDSNLESLVLKMFSSDFESTSCENQDKLSIDDMKFLEMMKESIYKDEEGYVTMPLPLKQKPGKNNSKVMALNRFKLLQKKLSDKRFSDHYHEFMNDIITQGDAEIVPDESDNLDNVWYIPHFGVYHPKKPDKIRVVFDGSAKVGGMCLNDCLLQGPDQMNSLLGILMRFRKELVGVTCDIGRMFHQFRVSPEFRDYLRFLWFDKNGNIVSYRMKVHLFGATSSPACATYGLRQLCKISANTNRKAKAFIRENFYVDDGLISLPDTDSAQSLVQDAISICKEGNLRLHKFSSNSSTFLQSLPESERNIQDTQILDPDNGCQPTERTLGLLWSLKSDSFQFSSSLKQNPPTRRGVLSTIASIYDPLGFLSPFILQGKNILQDMCRIATSWDEPLTGDLLSRWEGWKSSLNDLPHISIQRCYKPPDFGVIAKAEVHHFSDASTCGYGEVSYLRLVNTRGHVHCSLLISKARVAPLKPVTIPRLELQAAVTSSQISNLIKAELNIDVTETFWTDSQVVLGYLKNTTKKFHVYVTNRIRQVRDNSCPESWFYVPTSINPADHASRGMTTAQLIQSNWFTGPDFLWTEPIQVPTQKAPHIESDDPEVKSFCSTSQNTSQSQTLYHRLHRFSSWSKVLKVTEIFLTKIANIRGVSLQPNAALHYIVKSMQAEHFPELNTLTAKKPISTSSKLFNLNPFIDEHGVMRVGGRLNRSTTISFSEKHPILLPKASHLTNLLLRHFHEQVAHQGRNLTLAKMRSSGFWIIGARGLVTSLTHQCVVCRVHRAKPMIPQMSSLPPERSDQSPPFTYCGVDCFGPFMVKERRSVLKRYGLMVTCLASRAVHIEVLDDMSTSAFINSIRNVTAIRGHISEIWCDQGTNFVGALSELTEKGVLKFKLNPPGASHMGGVWERMIRTARNVFQSLLKSHSEQLDTSSLRTLMYEVMAIINSRPLSAVTEEDMPLTPNMLLTMKSNITLPPPSNFADADVYSRKRWRAVQHLANVFWKRWRSEYLSQLQSRQKWVHSKSENIGVGDVVLMKDDNVPRNQWPLAKVVECNTSSDQHVRSAKLLLGNQKGPQKSNHYLVRPVSKLIVLVRNSDTK